MIVKRKFTIPELRAARALSNNHFWLEGLPGTMKDYPLTQLLSRLNGLKSELEIVITALEKLAGDDDKL